MSNLNPAFATVIVEIPDTKDPIIFQRSYFQVHESGTLLVFERGHQFGPVLALARGNWNTARMEA